MKQSKITPWELLPKKLIWDKLSFINNMNVLDFGSGNGITANHFAKNNQVTAIEPNKQSTKNRYADNNYTQIIGSFNRLNEIPDESFDIVLCHCVLEYIDDKQRYIQEFIRVLKPGGHLSIVKHNRAGRVMQMVVLLNNFEHANELLDGKDGISVDYGSIQYYDAKDILSCTDKLILESKSGLRCFWHLQQNQEIHNDESWQNNMLTIEKRVSEKPEYMNIAMFHHLIFKRN